jgi:hypothetical protein
LAYVEPRLVPTLKRGDTMVIDNLPATLRNAAGQYRNLLTHQPHPLKGLDRFAVIKPCRRGQETSSEEKPGDYCYCLAIVVAAEPLAMEHRIHILDFMPP